MSQPPPSSPNFQHNSPYLYLSPDSLEVQLYKDIMAISRIGGWRYTIETQKVTWSPELYDILEIPVDLQPNYQTILDLYTPASLKRHQQATKQTLEQGTPYDLELSLRTYQTEKLLHIRALGKPIMHQGKVVELFGTLQDITPQKNAEIELIKSQTRFQRIFENANTGIVFANKLGEILEANPYFESLLAYPKNHLLGMNVKDFTHPDDVEQEDQIMQQIFAGEIQQCQFEKRYITANKDVIWVDLSVSVIQDSEGDITHFVGVVKDITPYKQTLTKLRQSEKLFSQAFQYASIGKALVSPEGRFIEVNPLLSEMLGYSKEELLALDFQSITHPDDLAEDTRLVQAVLDDELPNYQMEKRYRHKAGHWVWGLLSVSLVRDAKNQPLFFISQIQDISRRKASEAALKESQVRYQLVAQGANAGIWDWQLNAQGQEVEWWSDKYYELLGYQVGEIHPGPTAFRKLIHPNDYPQMLAKLEEHFTEKTPFLIDYQLRTKSGDYRWFQGSGQATWNAAGQVTRMVGSIIDIHNQKKAEIRLQHHQQALHSLNTVSFNPQLSPKEQIEAGLDIMRRYFDMDLALVSRIKENKYNVLYYQSRKDFDFPLDPQDNYRLEDTYCQFIFKHQDIVFIPDVTQTNIASQPCFQAMRFESLIGSAIWVKGQRFGTITLCKKQAQPEAFDSYDIEFLRIFARWVSFALEKEAYISELIRLNHSKDRILRVAAHDIRNPINAMITMASLLKDNHIANEDSASQQLLEKIRESGYRATRLLQELLHVGELEDQNIRFICYAVDLNDFIRETTSEYEDLATPKQLELTLKLESTPLLIPLQPLWFSRVLENLISNALKFTPPKGSITITTQRKPDCALISIQDSGIGIPLDLQPIIFDKFSAARRQGLEGEMSTGLGMYIVRQVVEQHQGEIWFESRENQGTTFFIRLPLASN